MSETERCPTCGNERLKPLRVPLDGYSCPDSFHLDEHDHEAWERAADLFIRTRYAAEQAISALQRAGGELERGNAQGAKHIIQDALATRYRFDADG